jgi:Polysaccharide pyruvyl transferase
MVRSPYFRQPIPSHTRAATQTLFDTGCLVTALWENPATVILFEADLLEPEGPSPQKARVSETYHLGDFFDSSQKLGHTVRWTIHLGSSGEMTLADHVWVEQRTLLKKFAHITTRGQLTTTVLEKDNIASFPIGCPSQFLNLNPLLGHTIYNKTTALIARDLTTVAFAVTLPPSSSPHFEPMSSYLLSLVQLNNRSRVIVQTVDDFHTVKSYGFPFWRVAYYVTMESWREGLKAFDAVIGCRIHGGMIAVAAELPSLVITIDSRVCVPAARRSPLLLTESAPPLGMR